MAPFRDKPHTGNMMRVFGEQYETCECGNPKGIKNTICTTYNNQGLCNTELVAREIVCPNCKEKES